MPRISVRLYPIWKRHTRLGICVRIVDQYSVVFNPHMRCKWPHPSRGAPRVSHPFDADCHMTHFLYFLHYIANTTINSRLQTYSLYSSTRIPLSFLYYRFLLFYFLFNLSFGYSFKTPLYIYNSSFYLLNLTNLYYVLSSTNYFYYNNF